MDTTISCIVCNQLAKSDPIQIASPQSPKLLYQDPLIISVKKDPIQTNASLTKIIEEMKKLNLLYTPSNEKCICGELGMKYCEQCQLNVCDAHIKEHMNSLLLRHHKIIDFTERKKKNGRNLFQTFKDFCGVL